MYRELARALLEDIFYPVSAVVCVGEQDEILSVKLFDTMFGEPRMQTAAQAGQIWLISNHMDGSTEPYEQDLISLEKLRMHAGGRRVRLFLASEEYACREAEVSIHRAADKARL